MNRQTILEHLRKQDASERRTWVRMLGYFSPLQLAPVIRLTKPKEVSGI
jgi:hypothetical protein